MHTIVHTEFAADDPAALAQFYKSIFGWEITAMGGDYQLWQAGDTEPRQSGGIRPFYPDESHGPSRRTVAYISVADIPATLERIAAVGGTRMIEKTDIGGGHGFYACFGDPAGNTVGLWSKE